ncbi:hypothetical protein yrohd0001_18780 [Yersinia rohdei ATCC 43380]|nr:hypothetical protein yrohd0001_18780 [Yersinia rohdei ATCC 43380]
MAHFYSEKLCIIPLPFTFLLCAIAYFTLWLPGKFSVNVG